MKIAHITDMHLCPFNKIPQSRTESFFQHIQEKMSAFGDMLKQRGADAVLISGDIFHTKASYNYTPEMIIYYQCAFESWGVPVYSIPGNHDLQKSAYGNMFRSAYLGLVRGAGNITDVSYKTLRVGDVTISGIPYVPLQSYREAGTTRDFLSELWESLDADSFNIVLMHTDAIPDASVPLFWETMSYDSMGDLVPKANLICLGHIHQSFPLFARKTDFTGQIISKPWSFTRTVKDYYVSAEVLEHLHQPSFSWIEVGEGDFSKTKVSYAEIPHQPFQKAFKEDSLKKQLENSVKVQSFIQQIKGAFGSTEKAFHIEEPESFLKDRDLPSEVREMIERYLSFE